LATNNNIFCDFSFQIVFLFETIEINSPSKFTSYFQGPEKAVENNVVFLAHIFIAAENNDFPGI
jgi:hypothetical protein